MADEELKPKEKVSLPSNPSVKLLAQVEPKDLLQWANVDTKSGLSSAMVEKKLAEKKQDPNQIAFEKGRKKKERTFGALIPISATVIRNGNQIEISTEELVKGDIIFCRAGSKVVADARVVEIPEGIVAKVDTSYLTGDVEPLKLTAEGCASQVEYPHLDCPCLVYAGMLVVEGSFWAYVFGVGADTMMGTVESSVQPMSAPRRGPELDPKFMRHLAKQGLLCKHMDAVHALKNAQTLVVHRDVLCSLYPQVEGVWCNGKMHQISTGEHLPHQGKKSSTSASSQPPPAAAAATKDGSVKKSKGHSSNTVKSSAVDVLRCMSLIQGKSQSGSLKKWNVAPILARSLQGSSGERGDLVKKMMVEDYVLANVYEEKGMMVAAFEPSEASCGTLKYPWSKPKTYATELEQARNVMYPMNSSASSQKSKKWKKQAMTVLKEALPVQLELVRGYNIVGSRGAAQVYCRLEVWSGNTEEASMIYKDANRAHAVECTHPVWHHGFRFALPAGTDLSKVELRVRVCTKRKRREEVIGVAQSVMFPNFRKRSACGEMNDRGDVELQLNMCSTDNSPLLHPGQVIFRVYTGESAEYALEQLHKTTSQMSRYQRKEISASVMIPSSGADGQTMQEGKLHSWSAFQDGNKCFCLVAGPVESVLSSCSWISLHGKRVPLAEEGRSQVTQAAQEICAQVGTTFGYAICHVSSSEELYALDLDMEAIIDKKALKKLTFVGFSVHAISPLFGMGRLLQSMSQHLRLVTVSWGSSQANQCLGRALFGKGAFAYCDAIGEKIQVDVQVEEGAKDSDEASGSSKAKRNRRKKKKELDVQKLPLFIARASQQQVYQLIRGEQDQGQVVCFLGNGTSSAPALKGADAGIAGPDDSDVSKEAADIIYLKSTYSFLSLFLQLISTPTLPQARCLLQ